MTTFLLDTNTCVEYLRNRNAGVVSRIQSHNPADMSLCSIVVAELFYGAHKSPNPAKNLTLLQQFAAPLASIPFDDRAAEQYGRIRSELERRGTPIGPNDTLIAAIAVAGGLTLVTHNTTEFSRLSSLNLEDWHT